MCIPPMLIAVTVLTSLDDLCSNASARRPCGGSGRASGGAGQGLGLDGVVCSAHEIAAMRVGGADFLTVVPGIRPARGGDWPISAG